jgi:hypothetical protein
LWSSAQVGKHCNSASIRQTTLLSNACETIIGHRRTVYARHEIRRMKMKTIIKLFLGMALSATLAAQATIYTVNAIDRGWYDSTGYANTDPAGNLNYVAGISAGYIYRDVFVFNLSGLPSGTISSATLRLYNPSSVTSYGNGYISPNASQIFQVGSVSTAISTITNATGGVAVFNDLAAGTLWGTRSVSSSDNGAFVPISLNASFDSAALSYLGSGNIALGGHLQGDTTFTQNTMIFAYTQTPGNPAPQLVLDIVPVPEPSSLAFGVLALVGFLFHKWKGIPGICGSRNRCRSLARQLLP